MQFKCKEGSVAQIVSAFACKTMERLFHLVLICYICLIVFILIDMGDANETPAKSTHLRQRRYLSFKNKTKFFVSITTDCITAATVAQCVLKTSS